MLLDSFELCCLVWVLCCGLPMFGCSCFDFCCIVHCVVWVVLVVIILVVVVVIWRGGLRVALRWTLGWLLVAFWWVWYSVIWLLCL